jgi:hypothetical protein
LWDLHRASAGAGVQVLYRNGIENSKEAADALVAGLRAAKMELVGDPGRQRSGRNPRTACHRGIRNR